MLFGRQVIVEFGIDGSVGRSLSGLRIGFNVKMTKTSTPNTARINIYNPAPESISLLQMPHATIRLRVGYDVPQLVFVGTIIPSGTKYGAKQGVINNREGVDRVLVVEAADGGRQYRETRINLSFATETTGQQVFDAVSAALGLVRGTLRPGPEFANVRFPNGLSLAGAASDILDDLARSGGSDWFVRDGALCFVGKGLDTGETAVVFSATNGNLIGSPTPTDNGVEVRGLLDPSVRPGRLFTVQADQHSGTYVARDVEFMGDSGFETPFYVVATGRPLGR